MTARGERYGGLTEDLSEGGVLVVTQVSIPLGERVLITLNLEGTELGPLQAEVRRHRPPNALTGVEEALGLMFLDRGSAPLRLLSEFVKKRTAELLRPPPDSMDEGSSSA